MVRLRLPQGRQPFLQRGNAAGHEAFLDGLLRLVGVRMVRRVLRIPLAEELVQIIGEIHGPFGFFFFGEVVLEGHHPVLVGDAAALAVVILPEAVPRIPDIAQIREGAALLQRHVPAVGLVVDVVSQMLRHLHDLQRLDVVPAQIVVVLDIGVDLVAVQILREVDDLLQAAAMVAHLHARPELVVLIVPHLLQLRRQIVELIQALIFSQLVIEAVHIAVVVGDEPLLIGLAEVVPLADADAPEHLLHLLGGGGELHPLARKLALVVLAQIGDKGGKGIVLVVIVIRHMRSSFSFSCYWKTPA